MPAAPDHALLALSALIDELDTVGSANSSVPQDHISSRVADAKTGEKLATEEINAQGLCAKLLSGCGICDLADKSDALLPRGIGGKHSGVIEGENLAASLQRLRKAKHITGRKWARTGIILVIIFTQHYVVA